MNKSAEDLYRIAINGGGLKVDASEIGVEDLCRIAANATGKGIRIIVAKADSLSTDDLVRIAVKGEGRVFFE